MNMETRTYRITPSAYAKIVMGRWLVRNIWILSLPVLVFIILAATCSATLLYASLMYIFLIFPFAVLITYFCYALTPKAIFLTRENKMIFNGSEITISNVGTDGANSCVNTMTTSISDICDVRISGKTVCIITGRRVDDIILAPKNVFGKESIPLNEFLDTIYNAIGANRQE